MCLVPRNTKGASLKARPMVKRKAKPPPPKASTSDKKPSEEWGVSSSKPFTAISINGYDNAAYSVFDETSSSDPANETSGASKDGKTEQAKEKESLLSPASGKVDTSPKSSNTVVMAKKRPAPVPNKSATTPGTQSNSNQGKVTKPPRPSQPKPSSRPASSSSTIPTSQNQTDSEKILSQTVTATKAVKNEENAKAKTESPQKDEDKQYMPLEKTDQDTSRTANKEKVYTPLKTDSAEKRNSAAVGDDKDKENEYESVEMPEKS